mgnify:CR=1 FL=1
MRPSAVPCVTLMPGASRSCPVVTTCSPAARPVATTASSPSVRAIFTVRRSTVWSRLDDEYVLAGRAVLQPTIDGVTIASFCCVSVSTTLTN